MSGWGGTGDGGGCSGEDGVERGGEEVDIVMCPYPTYGNASMAINDGKRDDPSGKKVNCDAATPPRNGPIGKIDDDGLNAAAVGNYPLYTRQAEHVEAAMRVGAALGHRVDLQVVGAVALAHHLHDGRVLGHRADAAGAVAPGPGRDERVRHEWLGGAPHPRSAAAHRSAHGVERADIGLSRAQTAAAGLTSLGPPPPRAAGTPNRPPKSRLSRKCVFLKP